MKSGIIRDLITIIDSYKEKYQEITILKTLLDKEYENEISIRMQKLSNTDKIISYNKISSDKILKKLIDESKDKKSIEEQLNTVSSKYKDINYPDTITLFFSIIKDYSEDIFKLNTTLKTKYNRSKVPSTKKKELINLIIKIIDNFKTKYKAFSYFHLRYILKQESHQLEIKKQLFNLIKDSNKYSDFQYIKFLFNLIFDLLDSIGGGNKGEINQKYSTGVKNYKDIVFKDKDKFYIRFRVQQLFKSFIEKIAEDVVMGKISHKSFRNLLNPYIQTLIKYYRNTYVYSSRGRIKKIFDRGRITDSFVQKFLNLSAISLKKTFLKAGLTPINIFELTKYMEMINLNNEIQIFVVYSIIMSKDMNLNDIAKKVGSSAVMIQNYARLLGRLINPLRRSYYINYAERISKNTRKNAWIIRKTPISLTGSIIQIPPKSRLFLINEIKNLMDELLKKYDYPYFIKEFLKEKDQKSTDYQYIIKKLLELNKIHKKLTYSDCFELFYIILETFDFIEAKDQSRIARDFRRSPTHIITLTRAILRNPDEYKIRFPNTRYINKKAFNIADDLIKGKINTSHFSNIDSFEFQQVIKAYRKYIVEIEMDNLIQKGYPSINSRAYNRKIQDFKRKNIFYRQSVGSDFIEWIEELDTTQLERIVNFPQNHNSKKKILQMCHEINKNYEILKYIIYLLLRSNYSLSKIARKSGKGYQIIRKLAKLLDVSICPVTNTYYIKDYEERFLKNIN